MHSVGFDHLYSFNMHMMIVVVVFGM